jgi:hypothetical protein
MAGRWWTIFGYVLTALVLVCSVAAGLYWYIKKNDGPGQPLQLGQSNGLVGQDRDTWYHLSQGTEFFPLHFLLALYDADTGNPFMQDLERFGFIPDTKGPQNPYGLPVGMTADNSPRHAPALTDPPATARSPAGCLPRRSAVRTHRLVRSWTCPLPDGP